MPSGRICLLLRVRAGQEDEYDRRHREIWPELKAEIERVYESFSVFRGGRDVVVCGDLAGGVAPPESDVGERWTEYMRDVLEDERRELVEIMRLPQPANLPR